MDTSTLVQQVDNVERNIAFLQKEHQILLTGLRLEIRQLKKRCNDLSCELSKRPPGRSGEEIAAEEELLQARLSETEQHLAEQECSQGELRTKLQNKGAQAVALQVRLRDEERRFLEELKRRSHKITALSRDLRKQTDIAAQLAFQLHSARFRLYHQAEDEENGEGDIQVREGTGLFCQFSPGFTCQSRSQTSQPFISTDKKVRASEGVRATRKSAWTRGSTAHA
ncbi:coiled-coil domain-containing protein 92 isoform X2 [Astyanax mexicanus]|uniref:coiled-coil domain-containing protein 92 isoform X2 n=1 Tax=Astyanax mexicanus TaxID=7994 RepID=UPI0020CB1052|nr:coiled-coil domain-containing protein 92 isoform X2 [Astyanax mexicanus]